ncbi:hypothetical protein J437_LFUL000348 [Ladona fulva]|uniref:Set2 Rpb1 interacting domain-containing protein n=1 Tax=Ladona fulva TaxID=123851 RepID=A0A8K0JWI1_LADFU|nr:hypothetical protein J437_LFUL000348 [Ladona fulva]
MKCYLFYAQPRRESDHSESEKVYRQIKDRLRRRKMMREAGVAAAKHSMGAHPVSASSSSAISPMHRHHGNHRHHRRHHHHRPSSPNSTSATTATSGVRGDMDTGEEGDLERSLRQVEEGGLRDDELEGDEREGTIVAGADTSSSDLARRIKDNFRVNMAGVIVSCLNQHRRPDCKNGRIVNTEDFKHLARKVRKMFLIISPLLSFLF